MSDDRLETCVPEGPFEALINRVVDERLARRLPALVRELLQREALHAPTWVSKPEAHRRGYPSPSRLRELQAEGVLNKGRRGRVNLAQLEQLMARDGAAPKPPSVGDLAGERARRAAETLRRGR